MRCTPGYLICARQQNAAANIKAPATVCESASASATVSQGDTISQDHSLPSTRAASPPQHSTTAAWTCAHYTVEGSHMDGVVTWKGGGISNRYWLENRNQAILLPAISIRESDCRWRDGRGLDRTAHSVKQPARPYGQRRFSDRDRSAAALKLAYAADWRACGSMGSLAALAV